MTELKILEQRFKDRVAQVDREIANISSSMKSMQADIGAIRENHLQHLSEDVAVLKSKMEAMTWWFRTVAATVVGNLIGIIYLIIEK